MINKNKINRDFFFRSLWLPESEKEIDNAIYLIVKEMQKTLHPIAWEEIREEFLNLDLSIVANLEDLPANSFISISELCGVSFKTLSICYNFGKTLFIKGEYKKAKSIFTFLILIYPDYELFWIGFISSLQKLKDKNFHEYVFIIEKLFPTNLSLTIQIAHCYFLNGNKEKAKKKIKEFQRMLKKFPKEKDNYISLNDYLLSRLI